MQTSLFFSLLLSLLASESTLAAISSSDVATAFSQAGIVPSIIPIFQPSAVIDVVYTDPTTQKVIDVTLGTNLTVQQTQNMPKFLLTPVSSTTSQEYVIALFDPDAPTPQNTSLAQFRHYLAGGYQQGGDGALTNGTPALTEYVPPGPPAGSDPHRYLVLVFAQSSDFDTKASSIVNASTPRTNFNITAFSHQLGLGAPIAGSFWFTGPEVASLPSVSTSANSSTATGAPSGAGAAARFNFGALLSALLAIGTLF
ncbi:PEBP-like protein [Mycena amicta]|nr:PEBP-like protein [Mycena amicta]